LIRISIGCGQNSTGSTLPLRKSASMFCPKDAAGADSGGVFVDSIDFSL
jgi:hypothetical protein